MTDDTATSGTHNGHLMVAALKRHRDKPVMYLGDTTLTGGEVGRSGSASTSRRSRRSAPAAGRRARCSR